MSSWTLGARKPTGTGGVEIDLAIDGGSPLTLDSDEAEMLETALGNALAGIDDVHGMSGRISCVNAGAQIIIAVDKVTVAALRYDKAELMRSQVRKMLAGKGTEFKG